MEGGRERMGRNERGRDRGREKGGGDYRDGEESGAMEKQRREGEGREGEVKRLYAEFHLNVFIVSASGDRKPQFWINVDIWGLLY